MIFKIYRKSLTRIFISTKKKLFVYVINNHIMTIIPKHVVRRAYDRAFSSFTLDWKKEERTEEIGKADPAGSDILFSNLALSSHFHHLLIRPSFYEYMNGFIDYIYHNPQAYLLPVRLSAIVIKHISLWILSL